MAILFAALQLRGPVVAYGSGLCIAHPAQRRPSF
jgi:hypothetical protein